jgi:hypothetical protein
MSNSFSLDDLNKAIETKYAPFTITAGGYTYKLRQVLRLASSERAVVVSLLKDMDSISDDEPDEEEILDVMESILSTITADGRGDDLVSLLEHDIVRVKTLIEMWIEATQAGEASPSPA